MSKANKHTTKSLKSKTTRRAAKLIATRANGNSRMSDGTHDFLGWMRYELFKCIDSFVGDPPGTPYETDYLMAALALDGHVRSKLSGGAS